MLTTNINPFKCNLSEFTNFDVNEILGYLRKHQSVFFSWGPQAFQNYFNKILRFKVNGFKHKGHIYILLHASDTFHIYLTTTKGTILKGFENIYIDQLVEILDREIEYTGKDYAENVNKRMHSNLHKL